jgi:hypothetical protein
VKTRSLLIISGLAASPLALLGWQGLPSGGALGGRAVAAAPSLGRESPTPPDAPYRSGKPPQDRRAFFGELHLHTAFSFDAWTFGTKITPEQAYRFARGEPVMAPVEQLSRQQGVGGTGLVAVRRRWPLDFMAVTDHSEFMGVVNQLDDPANAVAKTPLGQGILADPHQAIVVRAATLRPNGGPTLEPFHPQQATLDAWTREMTAANAAYRPGKFTTFIAYEWTAAPDGRNLHRNVIFNSDHAPAPFTAVQSKRPEDLWGYLEKVRAGGIDAIAIPHNGNASDGLMYDWNDSGGRPIDEAYAQRRLKNEPLTEISQNKGQSETTPELSPTDEFANFEIYDHLISRPSVRSKADGGYIRQAFGRGLVLQARVGANPYKFGVVGGSDIHNGLSVSDEDGVGGSFGVDARTMSPRGDAAKRSLGIIKIRSRLDSDADAAGRPHTLQNPLEVGSAGITGVWAEANTRNAIFAALKRKETFATSGTRIRVRMFGGWRYPATLLRRTDWVAQAYADGVPMGGDLPPAPDPRRAPTLILQAMKDPSGANLDRIQVIKVWRDGEGYKERVFDVALSGARRDDGAGHAARVGDTVDLKTGKYSNAIGAATLSALWTDPAFDSAKPAVYYARVLEIPTPRWSTLLAIANHLPIPTAAPATIQERAWTSPIWYTPAAVHAQKTAWTPRRSTR